MDTDPFSYAAGMQRERSGNAAGSGTQREVGAVGVYLVAHYGGMHLKIRAAENDGHRVDAGARNIPEQDGCQLSLWLPRSFRTTGLLWCFSPGYVIPSFMVSKESSQQRWRRQNLSNGKKPTVPVHNVTAHRKNRSH
ncbi:hypothetical protein H109_03573 [Trichophyton interdigitale MR816]|uniref:Uncharacterized protein n=1 Tax=Trichophyton interdigitale (strain MR816) TaxID=1215338 RepID=A0A059JAP1_TRIIM|nr:hypothetical protein H109_03573 [Trichophyton interdigitale MR816]